MQQFNKTLLEQYLIPLVEEIATDMRKGEKNLYLRKILLNEPLSAIDARDFINDYFISSGKQAVKKPFSANTEEDKKFHKKFLEEFTKAFKQRNQLSGPGGAAKAYLPDDKQQFSQEVFRNIYKLAYHLTLHFEKSRIQEILEKKKSEARTAEEKNKLSKDLEQLENGKLKLIEVNGEEQYVSEGDIKNYAANPALANVKVKPLIEVGTGEMMPEKVSPTAAGKVQAEAATFTQLRDDFRAPQLASMETLLEENGLQVVKDLSFDDQAGKIVGEVQDVTSQRLKIRIDSNLVNEGINKEGKHKFEFIFIGGETPDGKPLDGVSFHVSREGLKKFGEGNRRHSAYEVGLPQIASALGEERKGFFPQKKIPTGLPSVRGGEMGTKLKTKLPEAATFKIPVTVSLKEKPTLGRGAKMVSSESGVSRPVLTIIKPGKKGAKATAIKPPLLPMAVKAALPPRLGAQAPAPTATAPLAPPLFPGRIRPAVAPTEKKHLNPMAKAAIISGGAAGAAATLLPAAGALLKPEKLSFLLHCIGICIS